MPKVLPKVGDVASTLKCVFCRRTFDFVVLEVKQQRPNSVIFKTTAPDSEWEIEDSPSEPPNVKGVCDVCKALGCTLAQKGIQSATLRFEQEKLEDLVGE